LNLDHNIPEQEQRELDSLAAELRDAMPATELSDGFQQRLEFRMRGAWTLRGAFQRNGLIRAAAGLLVISLAAAPVAAWVGLWPEHKSTPPEIGFEIPDEVVVDESGGSLGDSTSKNVVGPVDEFDEFVWTAERRAAVQQGNYRTRLQFASAVLVASGQDSTFQDVHDGPQDWSQASWDSLWNEFGRRCQSGDFTELPKDLLQRCNQGLESTVSEAPSPTEIAARAAWAWVLHGEVAAAGSVELAWSDAPFVASE